jgi:N6-L-threonylcarbamoyladenine synthase
MKNKLFLGIDTSNYTTSVALCDIDGNVVLNLKKLLPVKDGERGLRQSDALFAHTKNLPVIMAELDGILRADYPDREILAVGYSARPRDAEGSYMPCFLSGAATAASVSAVLECEKYEFSHQNGHIMAALYSSGKLDLLDSVESFAAFHVSGGTTEMLLVTPNEKGFDVKLVGGTLDMNAGQAIDRTGVLMGLSFPCGKEMERICLERGDIPRSKTAISVRGLNCNLSGLENLCSKMYAQTSDKASVSAYCFDFIADTLYRLTDNLREEYPDIPVIYAGGVMSNGRISARLGVRDGVYFAKPEFSADNAAGIALLCRREYMKNNK